MIATIAEKKKFSDHIETTLQRSQRQRSLRKNFLHLSDCCRCDRWRVVSYDRYDRCGRGSFFFFLSDRSDRSDHMETGFNLSQ